MESVTKLSDAKKSVREKEYDLILADLRLPDGNSTLFLEWLNDENYTIPFLIMTNYGQVENAVQAMQLGAVNYLCKPIRPDKLRRLSLMCSASLMKRMNFTVVKVRKP